MPQNKYKDRRAILLREITRKETEFNNLKSKLNQAKSYLEELSSELATLDSSRESIASVNQHTPLEAITATQKITLFLNLFRGRKDVFPTVKLHRKVTQHLH